MLEGASTHARLGKNIPRIAAGMPAITQSSSKSKATVESCWCTTKCLRENTPQSAPRRPPITPLITARFQVCPKNGSGWLCASSAITRPVNTAGTPPNRKRQKEESNWRQKHRQRVVDSMAVHEAVQKPANKDNQQAERGAKARECDRCGNQSGGTHRATAASNYISRTELGYPNTPRSFASQVPPP